MRERLAVPGLIDVPVIIISAHAHTRPDGAEQLLKSGARICLPKPIGVEALLQAIRLAIV